MKSALEIIVGLKDIESLNDYTKQVVPNLKTDLEKLQFSRWISLYNIVIQEGKKYYNGTNENDVLAVLIKIDSECMNNEILKSYYETGDNQDKIEEEIQKIYSTNIKISNIEDENMSKEESKVYVKTTTHKTGTETGFASPLLLALLTASIEISTIAYIILNTMD